MTGLGPVSSETLESALGNRRKQTRDTEKET